MLSETERIAIKNKIAELELELASVKEKLAKLNKEEWIKSCNSNFW